MLRLSCIGDVTLPPGADSVLFLPVKLRSALADPATTPWPMGDVVHNAPWPTAVNRAQVDQAIAAAFDPAGLTAAFVVTYKGRIIGERYGPGEEYLSYQQRRLFDKLGIRNMTLETDPYGNFLLQGYELGTGRDWTRLALLCLNSGVWNGERILPSSFSDFVRTPAPAREQPVCGGMFWLNRTKTKARVLEMRRSENHSRSSWKRFRRHDRRGNHPKRCPSRAVARLRIEPALFARSSWHS
ncbi:MAG: hypothetical protein ACT4P6_02695 [Gemmatimonadaceae bacterium]